MTIATDLANITTALGEVVSPVGYPTIKRVYSNPTEKVVTTAELPCYLILWKQPSKVELMTFGGTYRETIPITIEFLYKPLGQGTLQDNVNDILAYRQPTLVALLSHLELYNTVLGVLPVQCTLPIALPEVWSSQQYAGFAITLSVIEQIKTTFGT